MAGSWRRAAVPGRGTHPLEHLSVPRRRDVGAAGSLSAAAVHGELVWGGCREGREPGAERCPTVPAVL